MTEAAPKSLVKKLAEVMAAISSIPKRGENKFHGYKYATEADIVEAIRGELSKRHIILVPGIVKRSRVKVGDKGSVLTHLDMTFTFMDGESGEELTRPWLGAGTDKEDKGAYKAMTGGEKYFLLKTFMIPTGDDPEQESKAERQERKQQRRRETTTSDGARVDGDTGEQLSEGEHRPLTVKSVEAKRNTRGDYWRVMLSDGRSAFTDDKGIAELARTCQTSQAVVAAVIEMKNGGLVLAELAKLESAPVDAKPF